MDEEATVKFPPYPDNFVPASVGKFVPCHSSFSGLSGFGGGPVNPAWRSMTAHTPVALHGCAVPTLSTRFTQTTWSAPVTAMYCFRPAAF